MRKLWHAHGPHGTYEAEDAGESLELQSLIGRGATTSAQPKQLSKPRAAAAHPADNLASKLQARRGVMHARAATKFQQLNISYKSREELQRQENVELPAWVLHPHEFFAQCWWTFISCTVMVALFVDPFSLAFAQYPGLYPPAAPDTVFTVICTLLYACDVMLNFFVAYYEEGVLVTGLHRIAAHYASTHLWADLVTTIPFDLLVLQLAGLQRSDSITAWYISLLRLLRMGRVYRLYSWVQLMTYNTTFSLMAVTLARNFALCFYTVHLGACGFYYIAKQNGFSATSWVGANVDWIGGGSAVDKWWYSMYWSIITFSTVGYGDLHAHNVAEAIFVVLYMFVSIGVAAYFVATSVLLVVENEKKTGAYRQSLMLLDEYSTTHDIPQSLKADMKGHLQLHFSSADLSDEAVLAVYPTTIRQRILRHMYGSTLAACWLFTGCKQKFLDALLAAAKVELYMPQVDIVTAGDQVNELHLIVAGEAVVERVHSADVITEGLLLVVEQGGSSSRGHEGDGAAAAVGPALLGAGDPAGEMAFFTETTCLESVRTTGMCRVLTIPRSVYNSVAADFGASSSVVLDNLVTQAEAMIKAAFKGPAADRIMAEMDSLGSMNVMGSPAGPRESGKSFNRLVNNNGSSSSRGSMTPTRRDGNWQASPSSRGSGLGRRSSAGGDRLSSMQDYLSSGQQQVVSNMLHVRALVKASRARLEQQRTHEFLNACSAGNLDYMRSMLQQGCTVGCCDYDGRSGLVLAASKGHSLAVKLLLISGADVNAQDRLGSNALLEVVKAGHDDAIELLLAAGGHLPMDKAASAGLLCSAVSEGNLALLRRLLHAGADPNTGDYDKRTALHIAAADCNLPVVRLLVEVGAADPCLPDRWQQTPLDEARRAGALPVVHYLSTKVPASEAAEAQRRSQQLQLQGLLAAASQGQQQAVMQLLERGCPPDACGLDGRTALMVAAAHGHQDVVSLLLSAGANPNAQDELGACALLCAVRRGHEGVMEQLLAAGAKLQLPDAELCSALCGAVEAGQEQLLRRFIAARADVSAADHNKQTVLHLAAAQGKLNLVVLLVEHGHADVSAVDRFGRTALNEAQQAQAADVINYLSRSSSTPASRRTAAGDSTGSSPDKGDNTSQT